MEREDVYTRVTASIVAALEAGARPWSPDWNGPGFTLPRRATGEAYRGINVLLLWSAASERGFTEPRWLTFKQAQEQGAHVRKGEKGTRVVYAGRLTRDAEGEGQGDEAGQVHIPFMKGYTVFNVSQVEGLGADWFSPPPQPRAGHDRIASAEAFFDATGAKVTHGGGAAFYSRTADAITLPAFEAFRDAVGYYSTRAHETVHWTGHEARLARTFGKRFGDDAYAVEELVAEIGAAFLCASLGLSSEPREDHAAYLAHWLDVLKADKRAIFTAASAAQAASDWLHAVAARAATPAPAVAA